MKIEGDTVWYKITTLVIVILLSINDGVCQSVDEQREQFFLEALEHPEKIKEQIIGYAQYKSDKDKQELYRIYKLTKNLINFEDSIQKRLKKNYAKIVKYGGGTSFELYSLQSVELRNYIGKTLNLYPESFNNDPSTIFLIQGFLPALRFRVPSNLNDFKQKSIDRTIGWILGNTPNAEYYSRSFNHRSYQNRRVIIKSLSIDYDKVYNYFTKCVLHLNYEAKSRSTNSIYSIGKGQALLKIIRPISDFFLQHLPDFECNYYAIIYSQSAPFATLVDLGSSKNLEGKFYQEYFDSYANPYSSSRLDKDSSNKRYWEAIKNHLPKNTSQLFFQANGIYNKVMIEALVDPKGNLIGDSIDIIRNFEVNSDQIRFPRKHSKELNRTFDLFGFPDYERLTLDSLPAKPKSFAEMMFNQLDSDKSQEEKDPDMQTWGQQSIQQTFNKRIEERRTQDSSLSMNQEKRLYHWVQESSDYKSIDLGLPNESDGVLTPLLMSKHEIKILNKIFLDNGFKGNYFLDTLATEKNIKKVESPGVLHISTHAENDKPSEVGPFAPDETKLFLSGAYYNLNKELVLKDLEAKITQATEKHTSGLTTFVDEHLYTKELQKLMLNSRSIKGKKSVEDYLDSVRTILEEQKLPNERTIQEYHDQINNFDLQDGALDSNEIQGLGLSATHLVTLATCGPINQYIPEYDATNIAELFLHAGTKYVIASFWPVNDEATTAFMLKFYKHWLDGNSERAALKKAQKDIREIPQFSHPYFWGGWMVYSRFYFNH